MTRLLLVSLLALSGCNKLKRFDLPACEGGFSLTKAMLPGFDYAELRDTSQPGQVLDATGEKCSRAADKGACEQKLAAASSTKGWSNGSNGRMPGHHYVVATRDDEVVVIDGSAKLGAVLAPIDTPARAAAVAAIERGISPACKGSVRKVTDGFEVHLESDSCFGPADEVIRVSTDGRTTVISADHKPATCVG